VKRGRPKGWRKDDARRFSIMVRLDENGYMTVLAAALRQRTTVSEVVRKLIAGSVKKGGKTG
jgi:hypothetical protein